MRQIWIPKPGAPEVLTVKEAPDPVAGPGQVRIRVKASGINFADIMARLGIYPDAPKPPSVVGYEVSGVVDQVGAGVKGYAVGARVIGLCRFGGYSDTVVLPEAQVFSLPEKMTFSQGAAIPVNYLTSYQMLVAMAGVKKGDVVLVHSAAGGVGFAAIDICNIFGAEVIGTASKQKHATLLERGAKHAIDYRTQDFEKETLRLTGGRGADIILDPVGGEYWAKGLRCLAPTGRLVVFGFSSAATGKKRSVLSFAKSVMQVPWLKVNPLNLMNENKGVLGVNLGHMWSEVDRMRGWGDQILKWYQEGKVRPTVDKEFAFDKAAEAHHYIQDRKNVGKVVLVP